MPLPSHILQTVTMDSVTQVRASGDYQRQVYDKNQWAIGYTSMLHHALGLFPFKDCFWSSNETQTGCSQKVCREPNALLETLSSLLSTGPVGPADKIGYLSKVNLMQTCRSDGVLLKPDAPAKTMDIVFSSGFTGPIQLYNLSHTFSRQTLKDDNGTQNIHWHYILAANTEIDFTIRNEDIGEPMRAQFLVFDYFVNPTMLQPFSTSNPLLIKGLHPPDADNVVFKYYVIVPQLSGYTLIGERDKFAVASTQRFGSIEKKTSSAQSTTTVTVMGKIQEEVHVQMYHQPTQTIEPYTCKIGSSGTATITCAEDTSHHTCTCE